ncbi:MAG: hypothetical protein KBS55_01015 [Bacteroidales bacterium]|nr:hypothetical protein [Candidatus Cryptobacteroides aphodequi]
MKKGLYLLFLSAFVAFPAMGQNSFQDKYERFTQQATSSYRNFRKECNDKYAEFLRQAWEEYKAAPAIPKPKEEELPPVIKDKEDTTPIRDKEVPIDVVVPIPEVEPQPSPVEPIEEKPVIIPTNFSFKFYGTELNVRAEENNCFHLASLDGDSVADIWEKLSGPNYNNIIADCLKIREDHHLCDWAYLQMLLAFSSSFLDNKNDAIILTAFLYCQSGYKMRLGMTDDSVFLLFASKHQIYELPYFNIDGTFYYLLDGEENSMAVANVVFPSERELSLEIQQGPALEYSASPGRAFKSQGYSTIASCNTNLNLINFFGCYPTSQIDDNPMTRWAFYANTPIDAKVKEQLYPSLIRAIDGKTAPEAADVLLDFVQTAFEYEYDDKIWGGDRAFFSEETLYYPYCDCEDRSILFSRLVRDLLGLDVVLVYYPGHLATAVKFMEYVKGDYISLDTGRYLVCDPTYIGAPIGMTMPEMDNKSAKVILLK